MARTRKSSQQILSEIEAEADGMFVRPVGIWTLEKLAIVHLYLQAFTSAASRAGGGVYVDGLAGPGICQVRGAKARPFYVWGSPLLGLRTSPAFQKCYFIEHGKRQAAALDDRIASFAGRAELTHGDVNVELPELMRNKIHPKAPCFCLLDPEGTELNWSTVSKTATTPGRLRMPELLILFPSAWLLRLLPRKGLVVPSHEAILDRMFPSPEWRLIYEQRRKGSITPSAAKELYVEEYRKGLESLGYRAFSHVIEAPSRPGGTRRERYRLVFATQHSAGEQIMAYVFQRPYVLDYPVTGQFPLFADR